MSCRMMGFGGLLVLVVVALPLWLVDQARNSVQKAKEGIQYSWNKLKHPSEEEKRERNKVEEERNA